MRQLAPFDLKRFMCAPIAHRGLHACGGFGPVENSIGAALAAVERGFAIECDVRLSRDGEAVVFHDEGLGRLTSASGTLATWDAADLTRVELRGTGECIPTLAVLLDAVAGRVPIFIELKGCGDPGRDRQLAKRASDLAERRIGLVALESFDPAIVGWCSRCCPRGLVGPPERETTPVPAPTYDFASWSISDLPTIGARFPSLPVTTWTVRTREQAALALEYGAQIVFEGFDPTSNS